MRLLRTRPARLRLTLLYSGMFLLLGTITVVVIFGLETSSSTIAVSSAVPVKRLQMRPGKPPVVFLAPASGVAAHQRNADLGRLLEISWLVLAITAAGATVLGWFIAGRALRPLRHMTATAQTITAGNLHERLALSGPDDEFKRLGDTFDDLLARLEASFEAQRRFVANASHELRTPLTLERTLLQVALADPNASAATLRAACEELLVTGRDQERLLEALLTLASTERGLEHSEPLDLETLARRALARTEPDAHRRGVELHSALQPAPTTGDPALVGRLIANLIENAVHHNDRRGQVEVATAGGAGWARLSVLNTGPVIAPDQLERLFEPFQRLSGARSAAGDGHHGLGLSIVRAITTVHGADVDAQPLEGGGLAVSVTFVPG